MRALVWIAVLSAAASSSLPSQRIVTHPPGLAIALDLDGRRGDDLIILDEDGAAHVYFGSTVSPFLKRGPSVQLRDGLCDVPLVVDGVLHMVQVAGGGSRIEVTSYHADSTLHASPQPQPFWVATVPQVATPVTAARIATLPTDLGGDNRRDLMLVWTEGNGPHESRLYARRIAPNFSEPTSQLAPPPLAPRQFRLAALLPAESPAQRDDEYLAACTALDDNSWGGFGFSLVQAGSATSPGVWFPRTPSLVYEKHSRPGEDAVVLGRFSSFPRLGVPIVKTSIGLSFRFDVDPSPPYVAARGQLLATTEAGRQFGSCIADFDGDGTEEMVWMERYLHSDPTTLVLADPLPSRPYLQLWDIRAGRTGMYLAAHHGTAGDFDGDGDPDLVLSCRTLSSATTSALQLYCNQRGREMVLGPMRREY